MMPAMYSHQVKVDINDIIKIVNEEVVQTPEGRKQYYQFLKNNPTLEPIRKLYGASATIATEYPDLEQHVKRLMFRIHPDKVETEEKQLCSELFIMVANAHKEHINPQIKMGSGLFANLSSDPKIRFMSCIQERNWVEAKNILPKFSDDTLHTDHRLACLCSIVLMKFSDLKLASDYSSIFSTRARDILHKCIHSLEIDALSLENHKQKLIGSLKEMEELSMIYEKEIGDLASLGLPKVLIPYRLCSALKEYFLASKNLLEYEKYLRQAIRHSPSSVEKYPLIEELKTWISLHYKQKMELKVAETVKKHTSNICQKFRAQLAFLGLSDADFKNIDTSLSLFQTSTSDKLRHLEGSIQYIKNIIEKKNYTFSSSLPSFLKPYGDYINAYSDVTINQLKVMLLPLSGLMNYEKNDRYQAASNFTTANNHFFLGLLQFEFSEYAKAIDSWEKSLVGGEANDTAFYKEVLKYIFIAMNRYDTTDVKALNDKQLDKIDSFQEQALKAFFDSTSDSS